MRFKLFVGGMESCERVSAFKMLWTDEEDIQMIPSFPKVLSAVGVPIIWFWGQVYDETIDEEPTLPPAFNSKFFSIIYDYSIDELRTIIEAEFLRRGGSIN